MDEQGILVSLFPPILVISSYVERLTYDLVTEMLTV